MSHLTALQAQTGRMAARVARGTSSVCAGGAWRRGRAAEFLRAELVLALEAGTGHTLSLLDVVLSSLGGAGAPGPMPVPTLRGRAPRAEARTAA